jgi:uncharacterized integral membrane protein (TIGR00697 family)
MPFSITRLTVGLVLFHLFIIALSNYLVTFPFFVYGFKLTLAAFTFPLIVVATDLTIRLIGKAEARKVVACAYIPAIFISIAVVLYTGAPQSVAYRIGLASATAYLFSNLMDVYVFQKIRERLQLWFWAPLLAGIVANILDTFVFFGVAFYQSENAFMAANWLAVAANQSWIKIIVSMAVVLPIYGLLLNYLSKKLGSDLTAPTTK